MFYRFMNDGNIKWRKLLYAVIDANPKSINSIKCINQSLDE